MKTIVEYLESVKDTTFDNIPFNEVDNLILCQLSYLDFREIVPDNHPGIALRDAFKLMQRRPEGKNATSGLGVPPLKTFNLLKRMSEGARFSSMRLFHHACRTDRMRHEQFSATSFYLGEGTTFVAFRGTDDSLVGWREDLEMSYKVVEAQKSARDYLDEVASIAEGEVIVGGHSKGGNLATFACATCSSETRERIGAVYCNDGPGFCDDVFPLAKLDAIEHLVRRFVPHYCIVGALLDRRSAHVVQSSESGIMQHSPFSWLVEGTSFALENSVSPESKGYADVLDDVAHRYSKEQRQAVVDALFDMLEHAGLKAMSDLVAASPSQFARAFKRLSRYDVAVQEAVEGLLVPILEEGFSQALRPVNGFVASWFKIRKHPMLPPADATDGNRNTKSRCPSILRIISWMKKRSPLRSIALIVVGVLAIANAKSAVPSVLYLIALGLAASGIITLHRFFLDRKDGCEKAQDFSIGAAGVIGGALMLLLHTPLTASSNIVFGVAMIAYGLSLLKRNVSGIPQRETAATLKCIAAGIAIILGVALLAHPVRSEPLAIVMAGSFVIAKGVYDFSVAPGLAKGDATQD